MLEVQDLSGASVKRVYEGEIAPGQVIQVELKASDLKQSVHVGKIITKDGVKTIQLLKKQ